MLKKLLLGTTLITSMSFATEGTNIYLKTGIDMYQRFELFKVENENINKKEADSIGYEITVETTRKIYPNLELGFGVSYQNHGNSKGLILEADGIKTKFPKSSSIPVYITGKYNIPTDYNFKPYIKTDLGYSFNFVDGDLKVDDIQSNKSYHPSTSISNGAYWGIGAGVEYQNFTVDLMYKINQAELKLKTSSGESIKKDFDYSRITLTVGYKFNFN